MREDQSVDRSQPSADDRIDVRVSPTRRELIAGAGISTVAALGGCAALPGDDSTTDLEFERLQRTPVYRADGVELSLPEEVPTVSATNNADLLLLPDEPNVDAEQAVEWLADERVLALLGDAAEGTWLAWVQSDAYTDTFDTEGAADSEPDPDLLAAAAVDLDVTRYGHTWADGPRDRDLLRALDEVLVDVEEERSQ